MSTTNQSSNCAYQYTVKRGDSFYLIAHKLGIQLRDLLAANPDIPPSRLTVGDTLCIPYGDEVQNPAGDANTGNNSGNTNNNNTGNNNDCVCPETPENICPPNRRTVVQQGQTASDLQLRYDLSYYTLQTANADKDLDALQSGDVVCIPENNLPCNLPTTVTLQENETLESIAVTYNLPIAALLRVNPCLAPEDFAAGVTIRLPN